MIVVDTDIIGYWFLASDHSSLAEGALSMDPTWAAPLLWRGELRNLMALYIRKNLLSLEDAPQIMRVATDLMREQEYTMTLNQVLELARVSICSAYDCEFVALAQDLEFPLVPMDRKILQDFQDTAISLEAFNRG